MIEPSLVDIINNYKTQAECKIQLSMTIDFISSKNSNEICTVHTRSNNIEIVMGNETDQVIKELFESLLQKISRRIRRKIRGFEFVFDRVDLLH